MLTINNQREAVTIQMPVINSPSLRIVNSHMTAPVCTCITQCCVQNCQGKIVVADGIVWTHTDGQGCVSPNASITLNQFPRMDCTLHCHRLTSFHCIVGLHWVQLWVSCAQSEQGRYTTVTTLL